MCLFIAVMNIGSNFMLFNFRFFSKVYYALILLILIMAGGTIGFMVIEDFGAIDAFYQTIIKISTVGFGGVHAFSQERKLFVSFLIITSFGTCA